MMDSIKINSFASKGGKKNTNEEKKEFIPKQKDSGHRNRFADVISQWVKKIRRKNSDD